MTRNCLYPRISSRALTIAVLLLCPTRLTEQRCVAFPADEAQNLPELRGAAEENAGAAPLRIEIIGMRVQSTTSLEAVNGQLEVRFRITNRSAEPQQISQPEFVLEVNGRSFALNVAIPDPILTRNREIKPDETIEGWAGFRLRYASHQEPPMKLRWSRGRDQLSIDVNAAARDLGDISTAFAGPDDCLAMIHVERGLDPLTIWLLTEEFRELQTRGQKRVVVHFEDQQSYRLNSYPTRTAIANWLFSVRAGNETTGFGYRYRVRSPVQFEQFFVAGMDKSTGFRSTSGAARIFRNTLEEAVSVALHTAYDSITVERALKDLADPQPGVRRAVVESSIDRLTATQLSGLLHNSDDQSAEQQAMIAENLYRVSSPLAVRHLADLIRSDNPLVVRASLRSLVRSVDPDAADALQQVWREQDSNSSLRLDIVTAVLDAQDYRHLNVLNEHATAYLRLFMTDATNDAPSDESPTDSEKSRGTASETQLLQKIFAFLDEQHDRKLESLVRRSVLKISDPVIQDVVMTSLLNTTQSRDNDIARQYIVQRLARTIGRGDLVDDRARQLAQRYGPRSVRSQISGTLLETIQKYPSPEYTTQLFDLSKSSAVASSLRPRAFHVAVRCATHEQLQEIIDKFGTLDKRRAVPYLLKQLALIDHPDWFALARRTMLEDDADLRQIVALFSEDHSVEATSLFVDVAEDSLRKLEKLPRSDQSVKSRAGRAAYQRVEIFLPHLAQRTWPDARRTLNRCTRSQMLELSKAASSSITNFYLSHPGRQDAKRAWDLRQKKDYDGALKVYSAMVKADPFYASAFVSRSSLHLRAGRAQEAMDDLQVAQELDPENPLIESLIALTRIRLGDVEEGLQMSEEVMASIPDIPTVIRRDAIYNTACAYGRAAEVATTIDQKTKWLDRGIELLTNCVERENGFSELDHVTADPDLNAFHNRPEWNSLLRKIAENDNNVRP